MGVDKVVEKDSEGISTLVLYDEDVIYICDPTRWFQFSRAYSFEIQVIHKDVSEYWGEGRSLGSAFYLLVELVFESKVCVRHTKVDER